MNSDTVLGFDTIEKNLKAMAFKRLIYSFISILAILFLLSSGLTIAEENNAGSFQRGLSKFFDYPIDLFKEAFESGWNWYAYVFKYLPDLISTINMAFFSTLFGAIFALLLSLLASKNLIKNSYIVSLSRRAMDILRSFPELVIAMIFLYLMGKSELPAVIAIVIHTAGALGKLFSEAIENADSKPIEGLQSCGARWWQQVRFAVIPQVVPLFISYTLLRLEINVRASTILGFVGAGGIGEALSAVIQFRYGDEIIAIMFLLVITIISLDYFSRFLRGRLIGDNK